MNDVDGQVLDISNWKYTLNNVIVLLSEHSNYGQNDDVRIEKTRGGGRDFIVNDDGTISPKHATNFVLGILRNNGVKLSQLKPRDLGVKVILFDIMKIDTKEQSIKSRFDVFVTWKDDNVFEVFKSKLSGVGNKYEWNNGSPTGALMVSRTEMDREAPGSIPSIVISTASDVKLIKMFVYLIPSKKLIWGDWSFIMSVGCPMNAHKFPYDMQSFSISIRLTPDMTGNIEYQGRRFVSLYKDLILGETTSIGGIITSPKQQLFVPDWKFYDKLDLNVSTWADWDASAVFKFYGVRDCTFGYKYCYSDSDV
jgi:hypothetical protein